jgi:hypothetical protein
VELVSDILLGAGALGAGLYCLVLGRRLTRFNDLEQGVGGAVAVLSSQVDDLTRTLVSAQQTAEGSAARLEDLTIRAEAVAKRMELMMAAMHDLGDAAPVPTAQTASSVSARAGNRTVAEAHPASREPMFVRHERGGGRRA